MNDIDLSQAVTGWDPCRVAYTDPRDGRYIPRVVPPAAGNKAAADGVLEEQTMPRSCADVVLPHLDAAFNDARWLTHHDADAEGCRAGRLARARERLADVRAISERSGGHRGLS